VGCYDARMIRGHRAVAFLCGLALACFAPVAQAQDPGGRAVRASRLRAMGQAFLAAGDPGSAAGYFREAIGVDPRDAESYAALGGIYLDRGSLGDALEVFSAGLHVRPDHPPLLRGLASALERRGALREAAEALRALVQTVSSSVDDHRARAELARRRSAWSEALASYRAIIDLAAAGSDLPRGLVLEAREYVEALVLLTGETDPVRASAACSGPSELRRALARCP